MTDSIADFQSASGVTCSRTLRDIPTQSQKEKEMGLQERVLCLAVVSLVATLFLVLALWLFPEALVESSSTGGNSDTQGEVPLYQNGTDDNSQPVQPSGNKSSSNRLYFASQFHFATVDAILSFISVIAVVLALIVQWSDLRQQRSELHQQRADFQTTLDSERRNRTDEIVKEWYSTPMVEARIGAAKILKENSASISTLRDMSIVGKEGALKALQVYHFYSRVVLLSDQGHVDTTTLQNLLRQDSTYWYVLFFDKAKSEAQPESAQEDINTLEKICEFCKPNVDAQPAQHKPRRGSSRLRKQGTKKNNDLKVDQEHQETSQSAPSQKSPIVNT